MVECCVRAAAREEELILLSGHPLTQLVVVIAAAAAVSSLFGLLKALRTPVGLLAYAGLILTLYAYYQMSDRYFSEGIWQLTLACLVVMGFTLKHVPFLRVVLTIAFFEFASRINTTTYPRPTVLALGVIAAMLAVATFWTGKSPAAPTPPPPPSGFSPTYRKGPQLFDPYTGRRLQSRRTGWSPTSALWRWARGRSRR